MKKKIKSEKDNSKKKINLKLNKSTIVFIVLDILALGGFFITYGPIKYFRNLYVTTAMNTMTHQYLARIFYSQDTIDKVMSQNYFVPIDENVDIDKITINTDEKTSYKDDYEKELLTRDEGNDLYKVINLKVGSANGYLVAIYDPTKVHLISTKAFNVGGYGERILTMCPRYGGVVCINAGGFVDNGYGSDIPLGWVIENGEITWNPGDEVRSNLIGMTKDGILALMNNVTGYEAIEAGVTDAVEFGPFLIVNGKPLEIVGDPWGKSPRVAIAQRQDGVMMFLVVDGENYIDGASLKDMIDTLLKYGAYNAANLDGGQSSSLIINNSLYNNPPSAAKAQGGRYVVTGFGLIP